MNNVDIKIYMAGVKKFFNSNTDDLKNLIPLEKKEEFYNLIESEAEKNFSQGEEIPLTQKQYIEICVKLNNVPHKRKKTELFFENSFGKICLN